MPETRTILILGASYAGLGATHYFLRHVYPHLPQDDQMKYQVVLVDPSAKMFQRTASPRAVVSPELISPEQIFLDIEPGLKQYGDKVLFIQAKATGWDEKARTVTVQSNDGKEQTLGYWALVLATGSKTLSPVFSSQGSGHEESADALREVNAQIHKAKSIVLSGGGPAAVETAGEIGEAINGTPGWCASRPSDPKVKITIITSASKLLPTLRQSISDTAEAYLARLGVEVRYNTKIASSRPSPSGSTGTILTLHDGEEVSTDLYIPATGVSPLSSYVPPHLKDSKGFIFQNTATLRVDAAGPRVYAVGDVGTASDNGIFAILNSIPVLGTNMERDLLAMHDDPEGKPEGEDRKFVPNEKEMQVVPVGRSRGVGAVFGWRLPSWAVWAIKGRDYMIGRAGGNVDGSAWAKEG